MVNFSFQYKNKRFDIDVKECRTFLQKGTGLMFRKKSKSLLFIFNKKTREGIHSFFCIDFIVIWFDEGKIVDFKLVKSWKPYILPKKSFNKFIEIPLNSKDFPRIKSNLNL